MRRYIELLFSPPIILPINLAIIIVVELSGKFFFESGAIHAIAIFFIALTVVRTAYRYYIADPIAQKLITSSLVAMTIFALSHVVEFLSYKVLHLSEDSTFANVANFYLISLFVILIGLEFIVRANQKRSPFFMVAFIGAIVLFMLLTIFSFLVKEGVSLEPSSAATYLYALAIIGAYAFGLFGTQKIKSSMPVLRDFLTIINTALVLVVAATLFNILYETLGDIAGIPQYQIIFLAHFAFFLALSFFFSAFGTLQHLGGLYKEVLEISKINK